MSRAATPESCARLAKGVPALIEVACFHREQPAFANDLRGIAKQGGDRPAIQRRRHDEHTKIGTKEPLCFQTERQACVGLQAAFVKFVEQDCCILAYRWIVLE